LVAGAAILTIAASGLGTDLGEPTPASADQLSDARNQATHLNQELAPTGHQISALGRQFDQAQVEVVSAQQETAVTQAKTVAMPGGEQVVHGPTALGHRPGNGPSCPVDW
jgi:hypothetical protein